MLSQWLRFCASVEEGRGGGVGVALSGARGGSQSQGLAQASPLYRSTPTAALHLRLHLRQRPAVLLWTAVTHVPPLPS